jgi:hypothetical protein
MDRSWPWPSSAGCVRNHQHLPVRAAVALALLACIGCGSGSSGAGEVFDPDGVPWETVFGKDADPPGARDVAVEEDSVPDGSGPSDTPRPEGAPELRPEALVEPGPVEPAAETVEPAAETVEPAPEEIHEGFDAPQDGSPESSADVAPEAVADTAPEIVPCPQGCDDGKPCTADLCLANGTCSHTKRPDQAACDDGDVCTEDDYCASGLCFAGDVRSCDDADPCSTDACLSPGGCTHSPATGPGCDDGDPCTGDDRCQVGKCQAGATNLCPVCNDDACDPPLEDCASCEADCGPCNETACSGGVDEDGDGQTDCDDGDCTGDAACPVSCAVDADLSCGQSEYDSAWGNDLWGYSCGDEEGSGSEGIYRFVSATAGYVTVWVTAQNDKDRYDVYLLSGSCSPSACTDFEESVWSDKSVSFAAEEGVPYYVVVERVSGAGSQYVVKPTCY